MAIQHNQLSELNIVRTKAAQLRAERLMKRESCHNDIQMIDLRLTQVENRLGILAILRIDCERSAKSLSSAFIGRADMLTETSRAQLNEKNAELKRLDDEFEKLNKSREELTTDRKEKHAAYQQAEQNLENTDTELRQIDQLITEIRGF